MPYPPPHPRRRAPSITLPGVDRSLDTPGVTIRPPTAGPSIAQQLMDALGVAGQAGAVATRYGHELRAQEDRHRELLRGEAATAAGQAAETLQAQISQDKVAVPTNPDELQGWAEKLIDSHLPEGMPEAYTTEYRDRMVRAAMNLGGQYQTAKFNENKQVSVAAILNGVTGVTDGKRLASATKELVDNWKLTPLEAKDQVYRAATRYAIQSLNGEAFATARTFAGLDFKTEQSLAAEEFAHQQRQRDAEQIQAFQNDIATMDLDDKSFAARYERIDEWRKRGTVPAEALDQAKQAIESKQRQAEAEAGRLAVLGAKQSLDARWAGEDDSLIWAGEAFKVGSRQAVLPNGTDHNLSAQEALDSAMSRAFSRIDSTPLPAAAKSNLKIKLASDNGYVVPAWKRLLNAGARSASQAALSGGDLPSAATEGLSLYRELRAKLGAELLAATADEGTSDFYERVLAIQEQAGVGATNPDSDQRALLAVASTPPKPTGGGRVDASISRAAQDTAQRVWGGKKNWPHAAALIATLARGYAADGTDPQVAVDLARKQVEPRLVTVNGYLVDAARAGVPQGMREQMGPALRAFARRWSDAHAKDDAIDADDVTVNYNPAAGIWTVWHDGAPVPDHGDPRLVAMTTPELVAWWVGRNEAERQKDIAEAKQRALDRFNAPPLSIVPRQYQGESDSDYARRIGRKRPGEM